VRSTPELFVPDVDGTIYPSVPPGFGGAASVGVAAASPAPAVNHYHQTVEVHVNGSVVSENDLVDSIYQGLLKIRRRNGDLGLA
jgi:hypothetical protein